MVVGGIRAVMARNVVRLLAKLSVSPVFAWLTVVLHSITAWEDAFADLITHLNSAAPEMKVQQFSSSSCVFHDTLL